MRYLLVPLIAFAAGCNGPLTKPMIDRLDEKSQAKIDEVWENMVTPPDQLDRTLLLDVILSAQLYQHGVDSMRFVSEKTVGDGLVVMEIRFDREEPLFDEFCVSYIDRRGRELRRERYSRDDINDEIQILFEAAAEGGVDPDADVEMTDEMKERRAIRMERMEAIQGVLEPMNRSDDDVAE